jgi:long-chain acyl-CoA synthetase
MTETCSGATSNTEAAHRFGTVGKALPGVEVTIAEDGEILVKSPGNMLGYNGDSAATAATLADGWVHTGDIGVVDGDGFLRITDRKKDLIKTAGGKYVAPMPIESKLMESPLIEWAVVVGEARPYVTALLVPNWESLASTGIVGEPDRLAEDPRVREKLKPIVDAVNAGVDRWETLKSFAIVPHTFSVERDELTPTLKPKRRNIERNYSDLIDSLYKRDEPT